MNGNRETCGQAHCDCEALAFGTWQPIETAPNDGSYFLVLLEDKKGWEDGRKIQTACFHQNVKTIGNCLAFNMPKPIKWMPLPEIGDE